MAPIRTAGGCAGVALGIVTTDEAADDPADGQRMAEAYGELLSVCLNDRLTVADLSNELSARYEELALIYDLAEALDIRKTQDEILDLMCASIASAIDADLIVIAIPALGLEKVYPDERAATAPWRGLIERINARLIEGGGAMVFDAMDEDDGLREIAGVFVHGAGVPLQVDEAAGAFIILREGEYEPFNTGDVKLFETLAKQTSLIISNARVVEQKLRLERSLERKVRERTAELEAQKRELKHEILDHRRTEAQLQKAIEKADAATRTKSDFLANMSHEIRTPLNGVIGMTGLLLGTDLDATQKRYAQIACHSARNLLTVINDILDISKIEAGKLEIETIDFDLRSVLEDVAEMFASQAHEKGLELVLQVSPPTPAGLRGDPNRLRQVMINLVGNALKFTPEGEIVLRVLLEGYEDAMAVLRFSVTDTGIGIAQEHQAAIYEAFTQADGSTSRKYGGTGLGLSISKHLVELMGGTFGFESEEGRGSVFWFLLALERQATPAEAPRILGHKLSDLRVLVVDDNAASRQAITEELASLGLGADAAAEARTARARLSEAAAGGEPYALVILDASLPESDVAQLVSAVGQDPALGGAKLIVANPLGMAVEAGDGQKRAIAASITKPIRQSEFIDTIRQVMNLNESEQTTSLDATSKAATGVDAPDEIRGRPKILLVEDDAINREVALEMLGQAGLTAEVAENGRCALEAIEKSPYDLILMDCQMPEMDGYESTSMIRRREKDGRHVPIIALTASALEADRERCREAGMDDFLSKPIDADQLMTKVRHWTKVALRQRAGPSRQEERSDGDDLANLCFDYGAVLTRCSGNQELAWDLLRQFADRLEDELAQLRQAVESADAPETARRAHKLNGTSASLGVEMLRKHAVELENMARAGSLAEAGPVVAEIEQTIRMYRAEVAAHAPGRVSE